MWWRPSCTYAVLLLEDLLDVLRSILGCRRDIVSYVLRSILGMVCRVSDLVLCFFGIHFISSLLVG